MTFLVYILPFAVIGIEIPQPEETTPSEDVGSGQAGDPTVPEHIDPDEIYSNPAPGIITDIPSNLTDITYTALLDNIGNI